MFRGLGEEVKALKLSSQKDERKGRKRDILETK